MPAIFYLCDESAPARRAAVYLTSLNVVFMVVGFVLLQESRTEPTFGGMAFVLLAILTTAADIYLALNARQGTADGLRLDDAGLIRLRDGRETFWPWKTISGIRLRGRFHPANLVFGRCISFHAEGDRRQTPGFRFLNRKLFQGRTTVIGSNYFVLPEELFDRLNEFRDKAIAEPLPESLPPKEGGEAPAVLLVNESSALNGRAILRKVLLAILVLLIVGLVGGALYLLVEYTLPETLDIFLDSGLAIYMALPVLLALIVWVPAVLWETSPVLNLVTAGAGGIFKRKALVKTHWAWNEIFDIELRYYPSELSTGRTDRTIGLTATHAGARPGKPPKDGQPPPAVVVTLEDKFDAPLHEIGARLQAWANWSAVPDSSPPALRPIRFLYGRGSGSDGLLGAAFMSAVAVMFGAGSLGLLAIFIQDEEAPKWIDMLPLITFLLVYASTLPAVLALTASNWNYLDLDGEGLTWRRAGRQRRWAWRELPSFELRAAKLWWKRKPTAVILFDGHGDDRLSLILRRAYRIDEALPRVVIEDVYASPIQEILAKLETYRPPPRFGRNRRRLRNSPLSPEMAAIRRISACPSK